MRNQDKLLPETAKVKAMRVNSVIRFGKLVDGERTKFIQEHILRKSRQWGMKVITKKTDRGLLVWRYE